jgi:uncharacterized protein YfiM (DUF2279 family)
LERFNGIAAMNTRMGAAVVAALLPFLSPAAARGAPAADAWLGRDKALHFGASFALAMGGYAGASFGFEKRPGRMIAGAAFALGIGVAKEIADSHFRGDPSVRDLAWDAAGAALGILAAWAIDRSAVIAPPSSRRPAIGAEGPFAFHITSQCGG